MRRLPQQARGEDRIAAILQAAAQVFQEVGFDAATTNMIARRANTAIGSLYDFFPNKETIAKRLSEQFINDMHTLYEGVLTDDLVELSLPEVIDRILDPLVQYHQKHAGFLALWLNSQDDPRVSAMGQDLDEALAERTAWILTRRYPQSDPAIALRRSQICMRTVQALTALAFKGSEVDYTVIAELKTMIHAYLREVFGPGKRTGRK